MKLLIPLILLSTSPSVEARLKKTKNISKKKFKIIKDVRCEDINVSAPKLSSSYLGELLRRNINIITDIDQEKQDLSAYYEIKLSISDHWSGDQGDSPGRGALIYEGALKVSTSLSLYKKNKNGVYYLDQSEVFKRIKKPAFLGTYQDTWNSARSSYIKQTTREAVDLIIYSCEE